MYLSMCACTFVQVCVCVCVLNMCVLPSFLPSRHPFPHNRKQLRAFYNINKHYSTSPLTYSQKTQKTKTWKRNSYNDTFALKGNSVHTNQRRHRNRDCPRLFYNENCKLYLNLVCFFFIDLCGI